MLSSGEEYRSACETSKSQGLDSLIQARIKARLRFSQEIKELNERMLD